MADRPRHWTHWLLLALAVVCLLNPRGRITAIVAMVVILPLAIEGIRGREAPFRWWATYVVTMTVFGYVRDIADMVGPVFVQYPIAIDRVLGFGVVPTVALQSAFYSPGTPAWWDWLALAVYVTHLPGIPVVGLVLWRRQSPRLRSLLLSAALTSAVGVAVHVVLATAPPWIAAQMGALPMVYRPMVDLLSHSAPGVYAYGLSVAGGNDVAAMPSLHAAMATGIWFAARGTRLVWVGAVYAIAMWIVLVYLGEHYVVDVLAGAALMAWSWGTVSHSSRRCQFVKQDEPRDFAG